MSKPGLLEEFPVPAASAMNTGIEPCPTSYLEHLFGLPIARPFPKDCAESDHASSFWEKRFKSLDVGPFNVTGHHLAVKLLEESLRAVKLADSELYNSLSSAGMLCLRHVRGNPHILSNHAMGLAVDFKFKGVLPPRGDKKVLGGTLRLYQILKTFGWFWGAEFRIDDDMHFEVGSAKVREWTAKGIF